MKGRARALLSRAPRGDIAPAILDRGCSTLPRGQCPPPPPRPPSLCIAALPSAPAPGTPACTCRVSSIDRSISQLCAVPIPLLGYRQSQRAARRFGVAPFEALHPHDESRADRVHRETESTGPATSRPPHFLLARHNARAVSASTLPRPAPQSRYHRAPTRIPNPSTPFLLRSRITVSHVHREHGTISTAIGRSDSYSQVFALPAIPQFCRTTDRLPELDPTSEYPTPKHPYLFSSPCLATLPAYIAVSSSTRISNHPSPESHTSTLP